MSELPFSQAAENNRAPILAELPRLLGGARSVLEIGAGTGQHAVAFAAAFPAVEWLPTEHPEALPRLQRRCALAGLPNLGSPQALDIRVQPWDIDWPDTIYTANTLHIVDKRSVELLFSACASQARPGSRLLVYGPFNYGGCYTADSNARFDTWLRERDTASGIRDFEWVDALAAGAGYRLLEDVAMPANNRFLCWECG